MKKNYKKTAIKFFAVMAVSFCVFANKANAQSWNISDNASYVNNVIATLTGNTLTISGTGNMADFYDTDTWSFRPPWYNSRSSVRTVIIGSGITNIGDGAFADCNNLTSVTISSTVYKIGVTSFMNCTSLTNLELPACITEIEGGAFRGCSNLTIDCRINNYPSNYPIITPQPAYNYGSEYPFNGIYKLRILPSAFDYLSVNGSDYIKEILYDGTLSVPTNTTQTQNFNILPSNCVREVVYRVYLNQGVNYTFNISNEWMYVGKLYNSSGIEISNYSLNTTGYAYIELGRIPSFYLTPGSYTLNYRCYLSTPTGITATQSGQNVNISWSSVPAATSYKLYRSNSVNGTYTLVKTVNNATSTTDIPSASGYWYYQVEAHNSFTQSDMSSYAYVNYSYTTATLTVSPASYNFTASGGTSSAITVTSNQSWTVSDNASWLTTSRTSGSNNNTFTMTATANTGTSSRSATVTVSVSGGGITRPVSVTQAGTTPANDLCTNAISLSCGSTVSGILTGATPTTNVTYTESTSDKNDVWYKFTTGNAGNYTITLTYSGDVDLGLFSGCSSTNRLTSLTVGNTMTYLCAASTTYYVRVINWSGGSTFTIKVDCPTISVETTQTDNLSLFPNPVKDELHINLLSFGNLTGLNVEITDLSGRNVGAYCIRPDETAQNKGVSITPLQNGTQSINVSRLPAGVYFVRIFIDNQVVIKKFVKE
ncbi:MAG: leucine-rich repeat protein [Paludibacter sp.]|jgi:hypothetical protein|nr:leucine-rich repeat protein [Paludibacter sp.]